MAMFRLVPRGTLFGMIVAPVVWIGYFVLSYIVVGVGCAVGYGESADFGLLRIVLLGVSLAGGGLILSATAQSYRHWRAALREEPVEETLESPHAFLALAGLFLCGISLLGVVWGTLAVFLLEPCG